MNHKNPIISYQFSKHSLLYLIIVLVSFNASIAQINSKTAKSNAREVGVDSIPENPLLTDAEYSRMIKAILRDQHGNIWIGTSWAGVFRYDSAAMQSNFKTNTHFTIEQGLCSNMINAIFEDRDGLLWFATDKGVCYFDGNTFTPIYFPEQSNSNFIKSKIKHGPQPEVESIMQDRAGNIWFGIWGPPGKSGAYRYNPNASGKDAIAFTQFVPETPVQGIVEDAGGGIWLGTKRFHTASVNATSNGVTDLSTLKGIFKDAIFCSLKDQDGYLWFGVRANGLYRFDGTAFSYFSKSDGLLDNPVNCIFEDSSGRLWLGSDIKMGVWSGGLSKYDPIPGNPTAKSFVTFPALNRLGMHSVLTIEEDQEGNLWLGGRGGKLFMYDGAAFFDYSAIIPKD